MSIVGKVIPVDEVVHVNSRVSRQSVGLLPEYVPPDVPRVTHNCEPSIPASDRDGRRANGARGVTGVRDSYLNNIAALGHPRTELLRYFIGGKEPRADRGADTLRLAELVSEILILFPYAIKLGLEALGLG